ncbi:aminotransferase class I/II-fold pyridoxal phosphate-dependent enzyme [Niveispirillum fermenti]|uniref:8-amino-7-oxononanoate synthase family protein n=1 Tax=Niveispirillum fermenti TaxID=1233113 RepID=UPI003A8A7A11
MTKVTPENRYRNNAKAIEIGNAFWNLSEKHGLAGIVADLDGGELRRADGHRFVNFSCCSYLDLDQHPRVIDGAIAALRRFGVLDHCIPRARVQLPALLELEASLGELFEVQVVSAISASVASAGLLPLLGSGHLSGGRRPLMIFDKNCHVSMSQAKPACADETEVLTCRHHDLDFIEDMCRRHPTVCYVCDGSDSLGGYAPVADLSRLQERYGLYVYYDDSHSLSISGRRGAGHVRSTMAGLDERTIIVATLNKAFGASGAAIMFGGQSHETLRIVERFAGALSYSQPMNTAAVGASMASAEIHRTGELSTLQARLRQKIALFDSLVPTPQAGAGFPIRLVSVPDTQVVELGRALFAAGYYVSPVFFPIVARGTAGLRVMMRVGQGDETIRGLCGMIAGFATRAGDAA